MTAVVQSRSQDPTGKRSGTHKFRQNLMGNLLREGIDFKETFSTAVSDAGICLFFSLAASCNEEVWGWDAARGYSQREEQCDVFSFLPSHHACSPLEREGIVKLRQEHLQLVKDEGEDGLKQLARKHERDNRSDPKQVHKYNNSSIHGAPSAGHNFELRNADALGTCKSARTDSNPTRTFSPRSRRG